MVPSTYHTVRRLPLNRSGKLDRASLAAHPLLGRVPAPVGDPLTTDTEHRLAGVWQELLERPVTTSGQNFFELGGDSLVATRLVARIQDWSGSDLTVRDIYEAPLLRDLGRLIDQTQGRIRVAPPLLRRSARRPITHLSPS
jgi:acyl carrier protein